MRFICDVMLGKLAKYLRLLGFDAVYAPSPSALEAYRARPDDRILLTRRKGPSGFPKTLRLESEIAREQLKELGPIIKPEIRRGHVLHRCIECNVELVEAERSEIESRVPEFVYHTYRAFKVCPSCRRVYWEGSHVRGMEDLMREVLS
jgi:hypothetical protein